MPAMRTLRGATAASAVLLAVAACGQAAPATTGASIGSSTPSPSAPTSSSPAASGSTSSSSAVDGGSPSPTPHGSLTGGGPLARLVVERMARTPFSARIEVHTTSLTKTDTASADLSATETGAISGTDLDLTIDGLSGGTKLHSRVIVIGDTVYASNRDGRWEVSSRTQMAFAIDAILLEVRRTVNGDDLADLGEETLDGRAVHHLTLTAPVTIHDPVNGEIVFDAFDLWVLADGSPVLRRTESHASKGVMTSSGISETHYDGFGTAIEIRPPKLPATPEPSKRPARP